MKHLLTAAGMVALAFGLLSCSDKGNGDGGDAGGNTIRIGHFASLTGAEATFGRQVDNGIKLAVEEINANGGVLGRKIELITEDTQSDSKVAINAAQKLLAKDKVVTLLGEVASSRSLAVAPIAQRAKVPMLTPASTNAKVTQAGDYIFRICFIDPFQGSVIARFVTEQLKAKRVALLKDQESDYSIGLAEGFTTKFRSMGGEIVSEQTYIGKDKDFRAQLTAIKASNPEVIVVPGYYTSVGLIAAQARDLGITVPLVGGDGWDSPELASGPAAKAALENCFFTNHYAFDDTSATVQQFNERYRKMFNEDPGAMSALGYDAMKIVAQVIEQQKSADPQQIRQGLATVKDFPGVTGNITVNNERNASKSVVVVQIRDGKFHYYMTYQPENVSVAALAPTTRSAR